MNLQAPPNLTPDDYPLYLEAGINDWGGVSPLTPDYINPEAPWPTLVALKEKSAEAGFTLKARLPIYPEFIFQADKFVPSSLCPYLEALCGEDGLMKSGPFEWLERPQTRSSAGLSVERAEDIA
jgi:FO synthase